MKTPDIQQIKQELFELVDSFVKEVHPFYVALNHTWHSAPKPYIPSEEDLRYTANDLINKLQVSPNQTHNRCATGGIVVTWTRWPSGAVEVRLAYERACCRTISPHDVKEAA